VSEADFILFLNSGLIVRHVLWLILCLIRTMYDSRFASHSLEIYETLRGEIMSEPKDPRVLFAAERTLLAWNRTSLSLIAFGFVVERAGLLIQAIAPIGAHVGQVSLSFWLGLLFTGLGSFSSAYSARQYSIVLRTLSPAEFPLGYSARWGLAVNGIVSVLGILLIIILIIGRRH
jgi:putative membrane protein